ncbi:MAG: unclassified family transposase [Candidatus Angelobacter sp.]|nr:unclassified family transposase [Candidatus Angelobacter sp.]
MKQPKTLQQAIQHFSDEQVCIDTVAALRWPEGVTCPACGHKEHYYLKTQKRWKCKDCNRQFSVKLGTIFEDSPLGLDKWLLAMWMIANCKNGVSSYEIHRAIGVTQKSAWFMLHRIRLAMQNGSLMKLGGSGTPVQVDETFIGGKARNMHKSRRVKMDKMSFGNKTIVAGFLDSGTVKTQVIANRSVTTLHAAVKEHVEPGAKLHTDDFYGYWGLYKDFTHEIVNHAETYVNGKIHTNGIENFWSLLKRGLSGTYVAVEPFHLFRYLDEQSFRYNNRGNKEKPVNDGERFEMLLSQVAGKRLTYSALTGKVGETTPF